MSWPWEKEKEAIIAQLYHKGLVFSEIARNMGITRSAVAGKLRRLGLMGTRENNSKGGGPRPRKRTAVISRPRPEAPPFSPKAFNCNIWELGNRNCRWPAGGVGHNMVYCGHPSADVERGFPYCPVHTSLAWVKKRVS
jgi:GcrA cell cycle regulator